VFGHGTDSHLTNNGDRVGERVRRSTLEMQSTPAPSPAPKVKTEDDSYPRPPQNVGNAPKFGVLVGLFERLQNERKQDRRMRHLHAWFNVCSFLCLKLTKPEDSISTGENKWAMISILSYG